MKIFSLILIVFCVATSSCTSQDPTPINTDNVQPPEVDKELPPGATISLRGTFVSFAHNLSGESVIYHANGQRTLRFENFTMAEGPDVYVLFSSANNFSQANSIAISKLNGAYSDGSLDFKVPEQIDLETHKFVLVYCVEFHSLFAYAELTE